MRPLRLILDGFGSYRHVADADFSDVDFFALTGPTGSGKSTLIDGLCFALYGTVPRWGKEKEIAVRARAVGELVPGLPGLRSGGRAVRRGPRPDQGQERPGAHEGGAA